MDEGPRATFTPAQQALLETWQRHTYAEFVAKDVEGALATMTEDTHVLLVPAGTGGAGKDAVRTFYRDSFIPQVPADLVAQLISQTIDGERLVEEAVVGFTHSLAMEWMLPGIAPTGRRVELALVSIIGFRDGRIAYEHLYWDQASVLAQLGKLESRTPAVAGAEGARRLLRLAGHRLG